MHDNLSPTTAARIARLRRIAARYDLGLRKSRCRNVHINDHGEWIILDIGCNTVVAGADYDLSLDDVADFLADLVSRPDAPTWGLSLPAVARSNN